MKRFRSRPKTDYIKIPEGFVTPGRAGTHLGGISGDGVLLRFRRGTYPKQFLQRVSPERWGVNLRGLLKFLSENPWGSFCPHCEHVAEGEKKVATLATPRAHDHAEEIAE